jgi:signal transduction histidine kinase
VSLYAHFASQRGDALHFIAQEAIMNATKHSQASVIKIYLKKENDALVSPVPDNHARSVKP